MVDKGDDDVKLCITCKHHKLSGTILSRIRYHECHARMDIVQSLVDGELIKSGKEDCSSMRYFGPCDKEGLLWEPKT